MSEADPFETIQHHGPGLPKHPVTWRAPIDTVDDEGRAVIRPWRECSYCGSMHPLDFVALHERLRFTPWHVAHANRKGPPNPIGEPTIDVPYCEMADLKYGFPHKIYVTTLETVHPDRDFVVGTMTEWKDGERVTTITNRSKGHSLHGKFYTQHFLEERVSDDVFETVARAVNESSGWLFERSSQGQIAYRRTL